MKKQDSMRNLMTIMEGKGTVTVTFEDRNTGAEVSKTVSGRQAEIVIALNDLDQSLSEIFPFLSDAERGQLTDSIYNKLAWWDTNKYMVLDVGY